MEPRFTLNTELTHMPYPIQTGKVFRGNIPIIYDSVSEIDQLRTIHGISRIVLLCPDEECKTAAKTNLRELYEKRGFKVTHFPIALRYLPSQNQLTDLVEKIQNFLSKGETLFIHCNSGKNRTGLVLACLARKLFGCSGDEAIGWVRNHVSRSLQSSEYCKLVREFSPSGTSPKEPHTWIYSPLAGKPRPSFSKTEAKPKFTLGAEVTPMPYKLEKGELLRGSMPHINSFNKHKISQYREIYGINRIILLLTKEEIEGGLCSVDLKKLYETNHYDVTHFPITDYSIPRMEELRKLIDFIISQVSKGEKILVHCMAGHGRTGLVLACLARRIFNIGGNEAIRWVRNYVPNALKSANQRQMVREFSPNQAESDSEFDVDFKAVFPSRSVELADWENPHSGLNISKM